MPQLESLLDALIRGEADYEELAAALVEGDAARLQRIPGIGKRTAERLVVELRDRVRPPAAARAEPASTGGSREDVVSALVNLGYPESQADRAAEQAVEKTGTAPEFTRLLREALRLLHR